MSTATLFLSQSPPCSLRTNSRRPKLHANHQFRCPRRRPSSPFLVSPAPTSGAIHPLSLTHNIKHLACTPINSLPNFTTPTIPLNLTPLSFCKYSLIISLALTLAKKTLSTLLNPFFWTYFSFTWVFWPYIAAASIAVAGLYSFYKHSKNQSTVFHQLAIVTSTIAWLTLVPPAHCNGFLEGWPIMLFFVYHYFFFFEVSVRKRLYGDLQPRAHDPKWDVGLSKPFQVAFFVLVLIGHFLAAYEGPELHLISGGWADFGTWALVLLTIFMRYHSVLYLAKYSEKVAVPTTVVEFGPYRWVRHPIYASTMLLFALHCVTLRAPLSLAFLVAVCVWYYGRKAELEEALMVETFGERYKEYMAKVRYRLIPLLY